MLEVRGCCCCARVKRVNFAPHPSTYSCSHKNVTNERSRIIAFSLACVMQEVVLIMPRISLMHASVHYQFTSVAYRNTRQIAVRMSYRVTRPSNRHCTAPTSLSHSLILRASIALRNVYFFSTSTRAVSLVIGLMQGLASLHPHPLTMLCRSRHSERVRSRCLFKRGGRVGELSVVGCRYIGCGEDACWG